MRLYLRQLLQRYMCAVGWHAWGRWVYKVQARWTLRYGDFRWVPLFSKESYDITITEGRRMCHRCGKLQERRA